MKTPLSITIWPTGDAAWGAMKSCRKAKKKMVSLGLSKLIKIARTMIRHGDCGARSPSKRNAPSSRHISQAR
ncbi:MAG: hypothetical protein R2867_04435 [Caldilineaceae bacterium]